MIKKLSNLLVTALGLALLVYSGARSLDFISLTLPPDKQILAWFGLAALDGGLVLWLLHYLYSARGAWQRAIALLMVGIDFLGAAAMFTLDTLYRTGEAGMTAGLAPGELRAAVLGLSGIIALNIGATVGNHLLDPEARRAAAAEEAEAEIEETAIRTIKRDAPSLAAELAPLLAADHLRRLGDKYTKLMTDGGGLLIAGGTLRDVKTTPAEAKPTPARRRNLAGLLRRPKMTITAPSNGNGSGHTYNAEVTTTPSPKAPQGSDGSE